MYWTCIGHALDMYWTCIGHVLDMYWTCIGHALDMYWTCIEHVLDMYWTKLTSIGQNWTSILSISLHTYYHCINELFLPFNYIQDYICHYVHPCIFKHIFQKIVIRRLICRTARQVRDQPEELPRIRELEEQVQDFYILQRPILNFAPRVKL
jgi:hypothetical protein